MPYVVVETKQQNAEDEEQKKKKKKLCLKGDVRSKRKREKNEIPKTHRMVEEKKQKKWSGLVF